MTHLQAKDAVARAMQYAVGLIEVTPATREETKLILARFAWAISELSERTNTEIDQLNTQIQELQCQLQQLQNPTP